MATTASKGYVQIDAATGLGRTDQLPAAGGSGTVTSVSVTTANGVSGSVATDTTTPAISLTLGAITPTSVSTGDITIGGNTTYTPLVNNSLTGANQRVPSHVTSNLVFTNASLTSIASANNGGVTGGHTLCITNATGAAITIVNNYGSAAAGEAILTGVGGDLTLPNNTTLWLQYNATGSLWACVSSGLIPIATGVSGLGTGIAGYLATNTTSAPTASALVARDSNGNAFVDNMVEGYTTTATAAGTTTLTVNSTYLQFFTGSTTQTVQLPVTSTLSTGYQFYIRNNSTGLVTITSSGSNTVRILAGGTRCLVTCIGTALTTAADWSSMYEGINVTDGKLLSVSNSLTLAGTDATTMTFPTTTATIARTDASQTFTGVQSMTSPAIFTSLAAGNTSMNLFNAVATTLNIGGAATTLVVGGTPTGSITANFFVNASVNAAIKTINIGTAGLSGSITNTNIGSAVSGATGTITLNQNVTVPTGKTLTLTGVSITGGKYASLLDTNGNTSVNLVAIASAVNYVDVYNGGSGASPKLVANGTDTNVSLQIEAKGTGNVVLVSNSVTSNAVGASFTQTLTNKRVTPRTGTTTSSATPTINTDNVDFYSLTAQAADITSFTTNLSGTPTEGQKLWIAITGTAARAITWGASFEASTVALPITTVTTARIDVGFIWNDGTSKWRCIGYA